MVASLPQEVVPILLCCTWYREMATSLWGVIQATLRAGVPNFTVVDTETLLTIEGAVKEIKE